MSERQWIPVRNVRAINAAESWLEKNAMDLRRFMARVHGVDNAGKIDIEFPSLHQASSFITFAGIPHAVSILRYANPETPFTGTIVVQVEAKKLMDGK